jgi:hypothetical protein
MVGPLSAGRGRAMAGLSWQELVIVLVMLVPWVVGALGIYALVRRVIRSRARSWEHSERVQAAEAIPGVHNESNISVG